MKNASFSYCLAQDPELASARAEYAQASASTRREAAEFAYDESFANSLWGAALVLIEGGKPPSPKWPAGFLAMAIDPEYAPAVLAVGSYEYASGRRSEGLALLLSLPRLASSNPDWVEIIDSAGQFLMDHKSPGDTCLLYEKALEAQPDEREFLVGLGWGLCRAGRHAEALPWMEKALAREPEDSHLLNDYGWALTELGRLKEAEPILEAAVRNAPPDYDLPGNNLRRLREMLPRGSNDGGRK